MAGTLTWRERRRRSRLFRHEEGMAAFLRESFRARMGFEPDLASPRRFSERLLWLRRNDLDPLQPVLASYPAQREYLRAKKQERCLARGYAEGATFREILRAPFPDRVLLRPTHLPEGGFLLTKANRRDALRAARQWYAQSAFLEDGAWEYREARPGLFAEEALGEGERVRVLCLGGEPRLVARREDPFRAWDATGQPLFGAGGPFRPDGLERAVLLARALAEEFPFLRVDALLTGGRAVFEGLRFYEEWSSLAQIPASLDEEFGSFLPLRRVGT